jgi:flavin reductase (DIM6/NTAB) family NADH-FMN oxidoreductase RutF
MRNFTEIKPEQLNKNLFKLVGSDWMLVAAESDNKVNAMTASWGGFGVMWNKNVAFVVIRQSRYTKELIDKADSFSLSFLSSDYKKQLSYFGSVSGRNEDKIAKSGLSIGHIEAAPYFADADLVVICKKLYAQEYKPECFIDTKLNSDYYAEGDYHTLYIAEITKVLTV